MKCRDLCFDLATILVFAVLGGSLGFGALEDLDLGWHLAGGLWIIDNGDVPSVDPFGSEGGFWWAYSWLAEVLLGFVFRRFSFEGLQAVQCGLVLVTVLALWLSLRLMPKGEGAVTSIERGIGEAFACAVQVILSSPFYHLRPQLLSLVFFSVLMLLAERKRLVLFVLVPLTILWANIHLYWVLVPLIVLLYGLAGIIREPGQRLSALCARVLLLFACGLVTPYGFAAFPGFFRYAFLHEESYLSITEFQPLSPASGYIFWSVTAVMLFVAWEWRRIAGRTGTELLAVFLLCVLAALVRVKFVLLFAVPAGIVVMKLVSSMRLPEPVFNKGVSTTDVSRAKTRMRWLLAGILAVLFLVLVYSGMETAPALTQSRRELLRIGERLNEIASADGKERFNVFSDFNDGGWLTLAFYLAQSSHPKDLHLRTAIDGRTLVAGEQRIKRYADMLHGRIDICSLLAEWDIDLAVLALDSRLHMLLEREIQEDSIPRWKVRESGAHWNVYERVPPLSPTI